MYKNLLRGFACFPLLQMRMMLPSLPSGVPMDICISVTADYSSARLCASQESWWYMPCLQGCRAHFLPSGVYSAASAGQQREDEAFKQRRDQKSSNRWDLFSLFLIIVTILTGSSLFQKAFSSSCLDREMGKVNLTCWLGQVWTPSQTLFW